VRKMFLFVVLALSIASLASADCSTLTFLTESLPDFAIGSPANFTIEAIGGTAPYTFQIVDGVMPAGLHMNSHGKISGVPREVADNTIFVLLTDANGCTLTQAFPIRTN